MSRSRSAASVLPAAALVLSCFLPALTTAAEPSAGSGCTPDGALGFVCGPANAEDLLRIGDSRWLLASGMDGELLGGPARGHLYLIDHRGKTWREAFPGPTPAFRHDRALFGGCPGPVDIAGFSAHGLALREQSRGRYRLYVTGHGAREAIEVFELDARGDVPAITWTGCVPLPADVSANSVAILPDWGFVTTKFVDRRQPMQQAFQKLQQGEVNGAVYEWRPGGPVRALAGTELSGPNGIDVSPDGNTIYVAAFGTRELVRFRRAPEGMRKDSVRLDITPDNVRWSANGKLLTAGGNVTPAGAPRSTAWSVVEVDPETLAARRIAGAERSNGMRGISTAVEVGREVWVGTFSGDRVGYLPRAD